MTPEREDVIIARAAELYRAWEARPWYARAWGRLESLARELRYRLHLYR